MSTSDFPRNPEGMPEGIIDMPADIQSRTFAIVRRGYDRAEVDAFMKRLAETISELLEERTVLSADATTALDSESIAESTAILEDAEERASRRLHAATLEADRLRTEARRTLEKATKEAQEMENTSRANAEQITNEAVEMRQQILRDLLRRRKEAQTHVEMLRAARDELLNVFKQVRRITAQVGDPLDSALDRAKQAADMAAKRAQDDPQESLTQFEAELQTARLSGVIPIPVEAERPREVAAEPSASTAESPASSDSAGPVSPEDSAGPVSPEDTVPSEDTGIRQITPIATVPDAAVAISAPEPISESPVSESPVSESQSEAHALDDIFARLRKSASDAASQVVEPVQATVQAVEAEQDAKSDSETNDSESSKKTSKSSSKSASKSSKKKVAKKKTSKRSAKATNIEDDQKATHDLPDDPSEDIPDQQQGDDTEHDTEHDPEDDTDHDHAIEDLKRQIKRTLTADESKVLQAIHRLHNKAPKKAEELRSVLSNQDARTEEFAKLLSISPHHIQSLIVAPLSSSLAACDITESETKVLIQQVRDVYRSFSQEQLTPAATELAKQARL